ncbi:MAG: T9SS type A sorting domain-containing protein [Bacteroidota bacterium]
MRNTNTLFLLLVGLLIFCSVQVSAQITTFPYNEDFEAFSACGNNFDPCNFDCSAAPANMWVQDNTDDDDWRIDNGETPSGGTGPDMDNNPGTLAGLYLFTEASGCAGQISRIVSPEFDVSALNNPFVDFYIHMFGTAVMGTMSLEMTTDGGTTWNELWTTSGPLQGMMADDWALQEVSLMNPGGVIQLRWVGLTGTGFQSDMSLDDIRVYDRPDTDVKVASIDQPESGCGLSATQQVTVTLENLSSSAVMTIPIEVQINGGGYSSVGSYMGNIPTGGTDTYSFTVDLSIPGIYDIDVRAQFPMDGDASNDVASKSVEHFTPITTFPLVEDFEAWSLCGNNFDPCDFDCSASVANGWQQSSSDGDDWRVDNGETPSGGTGPDMDNNPGTLQGQYLFTEASGCNGVESILLSPCLDLSVLGNPFVDFYIHMFGDDQGTMSLEMTQDGGTTWTELWSNTGQLQAAMDDDWALQEVSLTNPGTIIQLRWIALTGPGFESDMSLDDIRIYDRPDTDVGIESIDSPGDGCGFSSMQDVTITLKNQSADPVTDIPVFAQVNGGGYMPEGMYTGSIPSGGTDQYTFQLDLSTPGFYDIDVAISFPNDGDLTNDSLSTTVENIVPISTFPWNEDFESFNLCGNAFNPCDFDCAAAVANGWIQDENEGDDWRVDNGGTPSTGTGPAIDNNPGTALGRYLWVEASGCSNVTSYIQTPCMDISVLSNPFVDFYYHMFGINQGTMSVSVTSDDGATWTQLWSNTGEVQASDMEPWELASASLSGHGPVVKLRFEALTGSGFESDMALDDVTVYDRPDWDVNVVDIISPAEGCGLPANSMVTVVLESLSIGDTSIVPVAYQVNNGPIEVDTFEATISPNIPETFTFDVGADLSMPGIYEVTAWTQFEPDGDHTNDTTTVFVNSIPTITTYPYIMDWENGPEGWSTEGDMSSWELGMPAGPIINTAFSGQNAWVTNLTGSYNPNEISYLLSPCFDFSAIPVDPDVRFAIWFETENNFDEVWLEMTTDGGINWEKVGLSGTGENWYTDNLNQWWEASSGGWIVAENVLLGSAGSSDVLFRFAFSSDFTVQLDGVGIDYFEVIPPLAFDAEVLAPFGEYTQIPARHAGVASRVVVDNIGLNNLSNISADFTVMDDMGTMIYSGSSNMIPLLPPGFGVTVSPTEPFMPPSPGDYTMTVDILSGEDLNLLNNVATYEFTITETLYARDNGDISPGTSVGIGAGVQDNAQLGQNFELLDDDVLESVTFRLVSPPVGDVVWATVYDTNIDGSPNNQLAITVPYILTPADNVAGVTLTLELDGGPLALTPGTYFLGVIEPGENISLASMDTIFTEGTTWLTWDGSPFGPGVWANNEDFDFDFSYYIRANFMGCVNKPFGINPIVMNETIDTLNNGMIDLVIDGGVEPYTFDWSNGDSTGSVTGLMEGEYSVVITDVIGCQDSLIFEILPGCTQVNLITAVISESIAGANDGIIDLSITQGIVTPPFTYTWTESDFNGSVVSNDQDLSDVPPGTYCVIVSDQFGCLGQLCASVLPGCGPLGLSADPTNQTIPGSTDGSIDLIVTAGTPGYSYEWDNGATTEDIAGLEPGTYCVTVTDFYGCTDEICTSIFTTSVNEIAGLEAFELYPNPAGNETSLFLKLDRFVDMDVEVSDILGRVIFGLHEEGIKESVIELDVSQYPPGMYYVRLKVDDGYAVKRLVVTR